MVERQVVALEVEGSSPSSYPIANRLNRELQVLSNINIVLAYSKDKITARNVVEYYGFLLRVAKLPNSYTLPVVNQPIRSKRWLSSSFKTFVNLSSYSSKRVLIIHHSHLRDGLTNSWGNGGFSCAKSFFSLYKKFFNLIYSILHYNIPKLIFSNNIFREECCALNWASLSSHLFIWRYNYHSLFYKPSKLQDSLLTAFYMLRQAGITSGIVVDTLYHSKTIYYLHRTNFYSVGLVDAGKSKYTLNAALPALGENLASQLFFIRSIMFINRLVKMK